MELVPGDVELVPLFDVVIDDAHLRVVGALGQPYLLIGLKKGDIHELDLRTVNQRLLQGILQI